MTDVIAYFVNKNTAPLKAEIERLDQAYWVAAIMYRMKFAPLDFADITGITWKTMRTRIKNETRK